MRARALTGLLCGASALAVVAAGVMSGQLPHGAASVTAPSPSAGATAGSRVVTLVTGERVMVTPVDTTHVMAALDEGPQRAGRREFRTLTTPGAQYVVPDEALPYLGRGLDLSLFNITAPAVDLRVTWAAGASAHPIPGLALGPSAGGSSTARVSSASTLAAALAAGIRTAPTGTGLMAGVQTIRAAGPGTASPPASSGPPATVGPPVTVGPHFNLATVLIKGLDRQGTAAGGGSVSIVNVDDAQRFTSLSSFFTGTVAFSVPEGHYSLTADISTPASGSNPPSESLVVLPQVTVTAPQTVLVADARAATASVPVPLTPLPTQAEQMSATLDRVSASGAQVTYTEGFLGGIPRMYVTPVSGVSLGALHWYTYFRLNGPATSTVDGQPYLYDVESPSQDGIPGQFPTQVEAASLERLDAAYHSDVADHPIDTYRASFQPWETFALRPVSPATAPLRRVEYATGLPDIAWVGALVWQVDEFNGIDQGPRTILQAGQRMPEVYLRAPLVPGVDTGVVPPEPCGACRQGDTLGLDVLPWWDGGHAVGTLTASGTLDVSTDTRLYADGVLVHQGTLPAGTVPVPNGPAELRLALDTVKSAPWTATATRSSTVWTWRSTTRTGTLPAARTCPDGTQDCAFEPLLFADYDLGADTSNAVPAATADTVSIHVHHQALQTAPDADALTFDVSTDDGARWNPVAVANLGAGSFAATVPAALLPASGTGFVSVRIHASDPLGDVIDQTVMRAVRVVQGD